MDANIVYVAEVCIETSTSESENFTATFRTLQFVSKEVAIAWAKRQLKRKDRISATVWQAPVEINGDGIPELGEYDIYEDRIWEDWK